MNSAPNTYCGSTPYNQMVSKGSRNRASWEWARMKLVGDWPCSCGSTPPY